MTLEANGNLLLGSTVNNLPSRFKSKGVNQAATHFAIEATDSIDATIFAVRNDGFLFAGSLPSSTGTALVLNANGYIYKLTSSLRYKKDVAPIDIGLNFILGLNPVSFKLKETDEAQVGFVAEDFPDQRLVSFSQIDKQDASKGLQPESINYSQITAPLVKAIQEQQAIIESLTTRITALEGQ